MEINTNEISRVASEIDDTINSLNTELNTINQIIEDMKKNWESTESVTFFKNISNNYCNQLKELITSLKKFQIFISSVPNSYTMLDDEYGNKNIDV